METFKKKIFTVRITADKDITEDTIKDLLQKDNVGAEVISHDIEEVGKYRAWHIINGILVEKRDVENPEQAKEVLRKWINDDLENPNISYNAFGLEEFDNVLNTYFEYYNDKGQDIMEIMDEEDEEADEGEE